MALIILWSAPAPIGWPCHRVLSALRVRDHILSEVVQRLDGIALPSPPLSGYLGYKFGYVAVFALAAMFGAIAIACVLMIPAKAIDDRRSRRARLQGG